MMWIVAAVLFLMIAFCGYLVYRGVSRPTNPDTSNDEVFTNPADILARIRRMHEMTDQTPAKPKPSRPSRTPMRDPYANG